MSGRLAVVAAVLLALAPGAAAQSLDRPYALSLGPVAFGGDVSAVIGPTDDTAFFNYTDYELNALRMARVRLAAQWRLRSSLAVLAEVRAENLADLDATGVYVRWRPWASRGLTIQAGRIPPVVGAFPRRAYGRDNPMAGAPLVYQYLTSLRPDALPATGDDLLRMRGRGWRPSYPIGANDPAPGIPLVNAARWDTGVQAAWSGSRWEAAAALTRGAPAVPVVRETNDVLQWSARAGLHLDRGLAAGVSIARGDWIDNRALALRPPAAAADAQQRLWGVDVEYGTGRWLARAEWLQSAFDLPLAERAAGTARLDARGGFVEVRYRPAARWQLAGRAGRLDFGRVQMPSGGAPTWDFPVTRLEASLGFRVTRQLDVRGGWQRNWRDDGRGTARSYPTLQALYWF